MEAEQVKAAPEKAPLNVTVTRLTKAVKAMMTLTTKALTYQMIQRMI